MLSVVSAINRTGLTFCEDALRYSDTFGVVIDGATGLDGVHVTPGGTDAAWMAQRLGDLLDAELRVSTDSIPDILKRCAATLRSELTSFGYDEGMAYPSACVTIVREVAAGLECYALGDSAVFLRGPQGMEELFDRTIPARDDRVLAHARQISKESGCSIREALKQAKPELMANRLEKNTPDGYWVFDPLGTGIDHGMLQVFAPGQVSRVTLMTDGYMDAIDQFHLVDDIDSLVHNDGQPYVDDLVKRMHELADADPDLDADPRFKHIDDITALCLAVTQP